MFSVPKCSPYVLFPLVSIVNHWFIDYVHLCLVKLLVFRCIYMPSVSLVPFLVLSLHDVCKAVKFIVSHHMWILFLCFILIIKCLVSTRSTSTYLCLIAPWQYTGPRNTMDLASIRLFLFTQNDSLLTSFFLCLT